MKVALIVLDSVGVGELPDAAAFGDVGSHTLNHTISHSGVQLPELFGRGLGSVPTVQAQAVPSLPQQLSFGRMREVSLGKDTSTGHWEFMGVQLAHPFRTFQQGFPAEMLTQFCAAIGRGYLCNQSYSGTEVIRDFGAQHLSSGDPIVYTSADSVFQIAAHLDVVPIETLYQWCQIARDILQDEWAVARVIARPFSGLHPFQRVSGLRQDFSLTPPPTVLNALHDAGKEVIAIGKIGDIYNHSGISQEIHTASNSEGIQASLAVLKTDFDGLMFSNLVDFDALYGHRRDPIGYGQALAEFDAALPDILAAIPADGALLIVSDHGNDPTHHGTDHTREYALLLAYCPQYAAVNLGERASFADVGATIAEALQVPWSGAGRSFWELLTASPLSSNLKTT